MDIRTLETKITILEREIRELKLENRRRFEEHLDTENTNGSGSSVSASSSAPTVIQNIMNSPVIDLDASLTADQSSIHHRLKHFFGEMFVKSLNAEMLDLRGAGNEPQFHISNDETDHGFYIMELGYATYLMSGAYFDGTNWIAKSTGAIILEMHSSSGFGIYINGGLTIGAIFTPIARLHFLPALTVSRPLKLNAAKQVISSQIDLSSPNDVTGSLSQANGGTGYTSLVDLASALNAYFYTKVEVDAGLNNKVNKNIYPVAVNPAGDHNHGGAVGFDGNHAHAGSVNLT